MRLSMAALWLNWLTRWRPPKRKERAPAKRSLLDIPLKFAGGLLDYRALCTSVLCTGGTGSGKTSILNVLMRELLLAGCGFYIPCSKPREDQRLIEMCEKCGRGKDVLVVNHAAHMHCNFFQTILGNATRDASSEALILANGFDNLSQVLSRESQSWGSDARYWKSGYDRLLRNIFLLIRLAGLMPTIKLLLDVLASAPKGVDSLTDDVWKAGTCNQLLAAAYKAAAADPSLKPEFAQASTYWLREYPNIPDKSRGSFECMITGPCDVLSRGLVARILGASDSTLDIGEVLRGNKIVISAFNPGEDMEMAQAINGGLKFLFMKSILARTVTDNTLPFVLLIDEYQNLLSSMDFEYAALQRSSRGPIISSVQGIESIHALFPGENGQSKVDTLVANLGCKLFAAPTPITADWLCSKLVGQTVRRFFSGNVQAGCYESPLDLLVPGPNQASAGFSESMAPLLTPGDFAGMRSGGKSKAVDFLLYVSGRQFQGGLPFAWTSVSQEG